MTALTPKQAHFVREYLVDLNAKQAAIRAGYSPATAEVQGSRLLGYARVKAAVDAAMQQRSRRVGLDADDVLEQVRWIALSDIRSAVRWGTRETSVALNEQGKRVALDSAEAVSFEREFLPFVEAINSDELSPEVSAAIAEVAMTKEGLRVKMHDKGAATERAMRHLGLAKPRAAGFDVPPINSPADVPRAIGALLNAVGQGKLPSEEALALGGLLDKWRSAFETSELDERLRAVEERAA